ncbi:MAG: bile acid:sodium symporter [Cyclobacteriaceae bacterium]|nr:bile acid:sodium symporter [Cyclobacteriaceae bacterium]
MLLIAMILLAYWLPGIEKLIPLNEISTYGISGIFFFYGLKLNPEKMKEGLSNWKLHALIQAATFFIFPLLVICILPFIHSEEHFTLWLAVFFLAALPSTVSSSVVMVSIAKGNIPGAIFNASISGLIGIAVTPLWIGLFLESGENALDLGEIVVSLIMKILLPVLLGMILHRYWGEFANRHKKQLTMFDKSVILIIVYKSFSTSFSSGIFKGITLLELSVVGFGVIALFFGVYFLIYFTSNKLKFNREDRITALFCGSKKSLVHGSVFSSVLFSGMSSAGIFLVPIMIYHAFQLFFISILAQRMSSDET